MLNPLAVIAKHYLRRALDGYRMPVVLLKDAEGAHVLLRSPRGKGYTHDGHTFSVFASDTNIAVGHQPPGERWRNEAQITQCVFPDGNGYRLTPSENRSHGWAWWPGPALACYRIGPLSVLVNTVANQRRHYAEYCVEQSTKQAKAPA